jgi:hypothetical protein
MTWLETRNLCCALERPVPLRGRFQRCPTHKRREHISQKMFYKTCSGLHAYLRKDPKGILHGAATDDAAEVASQAARAPFVRQWATCGGWCCAIAVRVTICLGAACSGSLRGGFPRLASVIPILSCAWASSPKVGAGCGNSARPALRRGSRAIVIPTPTDFFFPPNAIPHAFCCQPWSGPGTQCGSYSISSFRKSRIRS